MEMPSLIPYRPWILAGEDIEAFRNPVRNSDDRSPFVRYARAAAMWAEWVREEKAKIETEPQNPVAHIKGSSLTYGLMPLEAISPTMSVPPSAKDHHQRLLEATQLYTEPIVVCAKDNDTWSVVANHELYAAAKAYQEELARPGKQRSSDYCLVAICDNAYLESIVPQTLCFTTDQSPTETVKALKDAGFADSPRTDDPNVITVSLQSETFFLALESGHGWTERLRVALGLRSTDFGSNQPASSIKPHQMTVSLVSPNLTPDVLTQGTEFPYGAFQVNNKPLPGANMWSLRDFRSG